MYRLLTRADLAQDQRRALAAFPCEQQIALFLDLLLLETSRNTVCLHFQYLALAQAQHAHVSALAQPLRDQSDQTLPPLVPTAPQIRLAKLVQE